MSQTAEPTPRGDQEPRWAERHEAASPAFLAQVRQSPEPIAVFDISTHGCGFRARWSMPVGARVWLQLPGLEKWAGTIAWSDDDKGGVAFAQPLHPAVALRFAKARPAAAQSDLTNS